MSTKKIINEEVTEDIKTLRDILYNSVKLYGNKPAYYVKKKKGDSYRGINYNQLMSDVNAFGTALVNLGLKGSKIALIGDNCYEWVVSYYAIVNGTGIVIPLDKELRKDEINNLLDTAQCDAIIFTDKYEEKIKDRNDLKVKISMSFYGDRTEASEILPDELEGEIYPWKNVEGYGEKLLKAGDKQYIDAEIDPDKMSGILFTSGTTGVSKGVMLSHYNLVSNILASSKIVDIFPEDSTLSLLPIHHTYESTFGIFLANYVGGGIYFSEGLKYISKNLKEAKITVFVAVPLILEAIHDKIWKQAKKEGKEKTLRRAIALNRKLKSIGIDASKKILKSVYANFGGNLRMIITGAAPISPNIMRGFEDMGISVIQGYGLTECAPLISGTPEHDHKMRYRKAGSVGTAVCNGEIDIIDKDENGIGEIIFKGPNIMLGYYNQPDETDKVVRDGWLHTGDLGFIDKENWLYVTGRKKNIIVTRTGKNIFPEELEFHLLQCSYIKDCMVFPSHKNGSEIVAVQIIPNYHNIESDFGPNMDNEDIEKLINKEVSDLNMNLVNYKRIREVIIRKEDFIRTTTKKIKRNDNIQN